MASASDDPTGGEWLLEPPGPGEIKFQISAGEDAEVTPEVRAALDHLISLLSGSDVQGYVIDTACGKKTMLCAPNYKCQVERQQPCLIDYACQIASTR